MSEIQDKEKMRLESKAKQDIEFFHPTSCNKYEALRGTYPNNRRLTGDSCSCGFDKAVNRHTLKVEQALLDLIVESSMSKFQIGRLRAAHMEELSS